MNPFSTGHQVIQFFRFTLGAKKGWCCLPFQLPVIPFPSVTSSLHPSSHPTALPEFCWDHGCTGSRDTDRGGEWAKTKPQPSHNPHTLDPAVSSHSPLCCFPFLHSSQLAYISLLNSCCIMSHCAYTQAHILYLAMTMYSSATVQCHLKYNAHTGRPCTCMHANVHYYACT